MLKLCRVTKVNVFFLVLVYVFNFDLFEFSAAILEKFLLAPSHGFFFHFQTDRKLLARLRPQLYSTQSNYYF